MSQSDGLIGHSEQASEPGWGEMGHSNAGAGQNRCRTHAWSVSTTTFTQITPPFPDLTSQTRTPYPPLGLPPSLFPHCSLFCKAFPCTSACQNSSVKSVSISPGQGELYPPSSQSMFAAPLTLPENTEVTRMVVEEIGIDWGSNSDQPLPTSRSLDELVPL